MIPGDCPDEEQRAAGRIGFPRAPGTSHGEPSCTRGLGSVALRGLSTSKLENEGRRRRGATAWTECQRVSRNPRPTGQIGLRCALTRPVSEGLPGREFAGHLAPSPPTWHTRRCGSWRRFTNGGKIPSLWDCRPRVRDGMLAPSRARSRTARTETPGPLGQTLQPAIVRLMVLCAAL